jgi:hypothetical protein
MAWSKERIAEYERWKDLFTIIFVLAMFALVFMVVVDPLAKAPVLGDHHPVAGPAGNVIPLDLGMN